MKKTSQIALGASVLFFLAAGTIKFWPEERFSPRPFLSPASASVTSPLRVLGPSARIAPASENFIPSWLRRDLPPRRDSAAPSSQSASQTAPGTLPGRPGRRPDVIEPARIGNAAQNAEPAKKTPGTVGVSLAAQNMPVGDVLAQVFHRAGVEFSLPGRLREPVNIIFVDAPLAQALDQTLSLTSKPHLTYHKENGVYVVVADDFNVAPPSMQLPAPPTGPPALGLRQGAF